MGAGGKTESSFWFEKNGLVLTKDTLREKLVLNWLRVYFQVFVFWLNNILNDKEPKKMILEIFKYEELRTEKVWQSPTFSFLFFRRLPLVLF